MGFDLARVNEIFNAKGGFISLATSDKEGETNIAPVGSVVFVDEQTLFMLRGPLKQTYKNLKENPNAVFMAVNPNLSNWLKFIFTGKFGASYGYRIYTRLREETEIDSNHIKMAFKRYGVFARLKGARVIESTLKKVLVFDILNVREIVF
ncbi:MAG: pyridoxamine 5'-phosphate oxidase family protein [Eubacteriales bacterium]